MKPKKIELPFAPDMEAAVLEGRKSCTSRGKRKGEVGDWFELDGRRFVLVDVSPKLLAFVAKALFKEEGVGSPEEFVSLWKRLHRGHYNPTAIVVTHFFKEEKHGANP